MALEHIIGLDHLVIPVRDLGAGAHAWQRAGFTISPRGEHSDYMGTANHTLVFEHDYLELMGISHETEHNQPTVAFLKHGEGVERAAFTTDDAGALADELKAKGLHGKGPLAFGRPVALPDGGSTEARFQITTWPVHEAPAGLRIFACQHETRDAVWIPQLQQHANGARGLVRLEIVAADPAAEAAHLARLIDQNVDTLDPGFGVKSGSGRASFVFYDVDAFTRLYPQQVRAGASASGAAAIVVAVDDLAPARALADAVAHDGAVSIPASVTTGVIVHFAVR